MARNHISSFDDLLALRKGDNEYAFYPNAYVPQWKIHLCLNPQEDVYPDLDEPMIRDVSRFLIEDKKINHKYANGGDGFKTYTVYTGSMEDTLSLATDLKDRFSFPATKQEHETGDLYLADGIFMRFEGQPENNMFMRYGHKGIPAISTRYDYSKAIDPQAQSLNKRDKLLIHSLAGHIFCARHYGEYYLGTDYNSVKWDKGIFESLGSLYDPQFLKAYIDLVCRTAENFQNPDLKTSHPIHLDIDSLIQPRTHIFENNITSIMNKWDKAPSASPAPSDDILERYRATIKPNNHARQKTMNTIANKW